jgi:hypothetical protein
MEGLIKFTYQFIKEVKLEQISKNVFFSSPLRHFIASKNSKWLAEFLKFKPRKLA